MRGQFTSHSLVATSSNRPELLTVRLPSVDSLDTYECIAQANERRAGVFKVFADVD